MIYDTQQAVNSVAYASCSSFVADNCTLLRRKDLLATQSDRVRALQRSVSGLVRAGRHRVAEDMIREREAERGRSSRLSGWLALAVMLRDPTEAFELYTDILRQAMAAGDLACARLAWIGCVDSVVFGGAPLRHLRPLLAEFECLDAAPRAGSRRDRSRRHDAHHTGLCARALGAALLVEPDHRELPTWRSVVEDRWHRLQNTDAGIQCACYLVLDHCRRGHLVRAGTLVRRIGAATRGQSLHPATLLSWHWARATHAAHVGSLEGTARAVDDATTIAEQSDIRLLDVPLALETMRAQLANGQVDEAASGCEGLLRIPTLAPAFAGHVHQAAAQVEGRRGRQQTALEHALAAIDLFEQESPRDRALAQVGATQLLLEMDDRSAARAMLRAACRSSRGIGCIGLDSLVALTGAGLAFADGNLQRGVHLLRKGLATARKHGLLHLPVWSPRLLAEWCRHALELDIETRFARAQIRTHALIPKEPPLEVASWPWPVRITTLGRFAVEVGGQQLPTKGRTELKHVLLLKVLVTLGDAGVRSSTIADLLWPEVDGDAHAASLHTTVHRARSLLGNPAAIVMENGALRLATEVVWVDAWACEHCLAGADRVLVEEGGLNRAAELCERALDLYRGPFLPNLVDEPWSYELRDRLHERLTTTVSEVAERLAACEGGARSMRMVRRLLHANPRAEQAYLLLMKGYARQGRWAEAMQTYGRCEAALAHANMTPSPAMQAERAKLRHGLRCSAPTSSRSGKVNPGKAIDDAEGVGEL